MKKVLSIFIIALSIFCFKYSAFADTTSVSGYDLVYQDKYICIICETIEVNELDNIATHNNLQRTATSKSVSKNYQIFDSEKTKLASFVLKASFVYDGTDSQCISVSHATNTNPLENKTLSNTFTITCSKDGTIY